MGLLVRFASLFFGFHDSAAPHVIHFVAGAASVVLLRSPWGLGGFLISIPSFLFFSGGLQNPSAGLFYAGSALAGNLLGCVILRWVYENSFLAKPVRIVGTVTGAVLLIFLSTFEARYAVRIESKIANEVRWERNGPVFLPPVSPSPDDHKITFSISERDVCSIYSAALDGSEIKRLSFPKNGEVHSYPVFTSDGKKILYVCASQKNEGSFSSLHAVGLDGSGDRSITNLEGHIREAVPSMDGKFIYILYKTEKRHDLIQGSTFIGSILTEKI